MGNKWMRKIHEDTLKGDGHATGRKLHTVTESVPYSQSSHVEKRFTMIHHTALDGSPV